MYYNEYSTYYNEYIFSYFSNSSINLFFKLPVNLVIHFLSELASKEIEEEIAYWWVRDEKMEIVFKPSAKIK